MVVGDISLITSVAIRLANNVIGTSIPVFSADEITHLISSASYLKMGASIGVGKILNTIDNFRNRSQRPRPETAPTPKKGKKEQEQKRKLWGQQQKARLKNDLLENIGKKKEQSKTEMDSEEEDFSQTKTPRAIATRLKEFQREEIASKQEKTLAVQVQGGVETDPTVSRLKNIYRIINGASAITFFGLIITLFTMNLQLLVGNLLGSKLVPKLSFFEIIIIIFLDLLFIFITLFLIIFIYSVLNPCEIVKLIPQWEEVVNVLGAVCTFMGKAVGFAKNLF